MEIDAKQAQTRFPQLIESVQEGERITITQHGEPVAEIVPLVRDDVPGFIKVWAERMAMREEVHARLS